MWCFLGEREENMKKKVMSILLSLLVGISAISCVSVPESSNSDESGSAASDDLPQDSDSTQLYSHITNDDYLEMLENYNEIFMDKMSIVSTNQVSSLISQDATIGEVVAEIDRVLSEIDSASASLQEYYDTFDQNRSEAPMQTRIMTLLSDAQSALTQYKMAMEYLKWYSNSPNQEYLDGFTEYTQKAQESINDYNTVLEEELSKLGAE